MIRRALALLLLLALAWLGLAVWVIAPLRLQAPEVVKTARILAQAPFAEQIVVGDSRVLWADPQGPPLFAAFGGATSGQLRRLVIVLCHVSRAEMVIALGVNDAQQGPGGAAAAAMNLSAMAQACASDGVVLAEPWPVAPEAGPEARRFDPAAISAINRAIRRLDRQAGIRRIAAPLISGHTVDGVHLTPAAEQRYIAALARP